MPTGLHYSSNVSVSSFFCPPDPHRKRNTKGPLSRRMPAELQRFSRPGCGFESRRGRHTPSRSRVFLPVGSVPERELWPRSSIGRAGHVSPPLCRRDRFSGIGPVWQSAAPGPRKPKGRTLIPDQKTGRNACGVTCLSHISNLATPCPPDLIRKEAPGECRRNYMPPPVPGHRAVRFRFWQSPRRQTRSTRGAGSGNRFFTLVAGVHCRRYFHDDVR